MTSYKANTVMVLTVEEGKDRQKWLAVRNMGIGGSDAATIMGLNPYKSPYRLWLEKTGQAEPPDLSDNQFVYWGTVNEGNIANWFSEQTGKKVMRCGTLQNVENPWMLANVDRLIVGENAGLEIKTAGVSQYKKWQDDEVPDQYYCQCLHYMAVTGADAWYIAVLIGGNEARWKKIQRNEDDIKALVEREKEFWQLVQDKNTPPVDWTDDCAAALRERYKDGADREIHLTDKYDKLIEDIARDTEIIDGLKRNIQFCKNEIMEAMGDAEKAVTERHTVTWKAGKPRETISLSKIKKQDADMYKTLKEKGLVTVSEAARVLRFK